MNYKIKKVHKDIIQGTDEWFELKKLKLSASFGIAIGNYGKGLDTHIENLILDMIVEKGEPYTNKDLDRGHELEDIARTKYEFEYGCKIEQVGFVEINDYLGFSPDGFIGKDEGAEIKCRDNKAHFKLILSDKLDGATIWQVQMSLLLSGRKVWNVLNYNPNFKRSLIVHKVYPDPDKFKDLSIGIEKGIKMLKELLANEKVKFELKTA